MLTKFNSHYKEAIEFLDERYAYFVTHVLNIGKPLSDMTVPTAAVVIDPKEKDLGKFSFVFNPEFEAKLDLPEYAFILSHETLHILLRHLSLARAFNDKTRFNLAADAVINDYLTQAGLAQPEGTIKGIELVGYNCANATVSQVYDDIPQETVDKYNMGQGMWIELDDHTWIHVPPSELRKALEDAMKGAPIPSELDDIKEDLNSPSMIKRMYGGLKAGTGVSGMSRFIEDTSVTLEWAKLLQKIDPDVFKDWGGKPPRPSYHKRPRKLGAFPDLIMPIKKKDERAKFGEKKLVFMALDTSGSIGEQTANYFVNLARSVSRTRISLKVITFTSVAMELDLDNPQFQSGGTDFSPIEKWIQKEVLPTNKNKYPNSVVVVTDGQARFNTTQVDPKHKDRWFWLLEGHTDPNSWIKHFFGEASRLSDYTSKK